MSENTKVYEAMFLISQGEAADMNSIVEHLNEIFARSNAEVVAMRKWDERRLTYEIDKQRRAVYILCYFRAQTGAIARFERDCTLSERIMRVLVLKADHLSDEEIAAEDDRSSLAGAGGGAGGGSRGGSSEGTTETEGEVAAESDTNSVLVETTAVEVDIKAAESGED